jgi:hypothetical protein
MLKMIPLTLALLLWQSVPAQLPQESAARLSYFRYRRSLVVPAAEGETCAVLDAPIFPHAAPYLKDVRLYRNQDIARPRAAGIYPLPYFTTLSEPAQLESEDAPALNLKQTGHRIVFDLKMPAREYTDVILNLGGQDFIASAAVSGSDSLDSPHSTSLGDFKLFDLTSQHLSRGTTLHLQESSFAYLHVALDVTSVSSRSVFKPNALMVRGATVPPSREAQSLFTTVAETSTLEQRGSATVARFAVAERVPIERVSFVLAPQFKDNFSRVVQIADRPVSDPSSTESTAGTVLNVHLTQAGREVQQQQLSVPAVLGGNMQSPAVVEVSIQNGSAPPLPVAAVRLEMRERKLCFDAGAAHGGATLFYGDPALPNAGDAYPAAFSVEGKMSTAKLGPEQFNPYYAPRRDDRPLLRRKPQILWVALLLGIGMMGILGFRSWGHHHHRHY